MDYGFNEEQELFRRSVRDFLQNESPISAAREMEVKGQDYSRELYHKMGQLGWLGLMIPEKYGGSGGGWVETAIFYLE